jgi:5-formyltetrahydrofolate cyclo-ligase
LTLHWVDDPADMAPGAFGVLEPPAEAPLAPPDAIEVAIVPGVAFDEAGRRIGFGKGYYDALLAEWGDRVFTVGIAYDEQVVDACPAEAHDRGVSVIVTPTRTIRCATTNS